MFCKTILLFIFFIGCTSAFKSCVSLQSSVTNQWCQSSCNSNPPVCPTSTCSCAPPLPAGTLSGTGWRWFKNTTQTAPSCKSYSNAVCASFCLQPNKACSSCCRRCVDQGCGYCNGGQNNCGTCNPSDADLGCGCGEPAPGLCGCKTCGVCSADEANAVAFTYFDSAAPTTNIELKTCDGTTITTFTGDSAPDPVGILLCVPENTGAINAVVSSSSAGPLAPVVMINYPSGDYIIFASQPLPHTATGSGCTACPAGTVSRNIEVDFVGDSDVLGFSILNCAGGVLYTVDFTSVYPSLTPEQAGYLVYVKNFCVPTSGYQVVVDYQDLNNIYYLASLTWAGTEEGSVVDGTLSTCA